MTVGQVATTDVDCRSDLMKVSEACSELGWRAASFREPGQEYAFSSFWNDNELVIVRKTGLTAEAVRACLSEMVRLK